MTNKVKSAKDVEGFLLIYPDVDSGETQIVFRVYDENDKSSFNDYKITASGLEDQTTKRGNS